MCIVLNFLMQLKSKYLGPLSGRRPWNQPNVAGNFCFLVCAPDVSCCTCTLHLHGKVLVQGELQRWFL